MDWWLEFEAAGSCSRCERGVGCGAGLFARLLAPARGLRLRTNNHLGLEHGSVVRAGVEARWLVYAAACLYLLPLIVFMTGVLAADAVYPGNDVLALVAGLALSGGSILPARRLTRQLPLPVITQTTDNPTLESQRNCSHID